MSRRSPDDDGPSNYTPNYNIRGPVYLKVLLPDRVTGSVIGRGGQVLNDFEHRTGAQVKVSPTRLFFPTTNERMIMMGGEFDSVRSMLPRLAGKQQEHGMEPGNMIMRVVIPTTSIAAIIGKGGDVIKTIQNRTGTRVHVGERIEGLPEAIVDVKGDERQVIDGVTEIMSIIQADPRLRDLVGFYYGSGPSAPRRPQEDHDRYTPPPPPPQHHPEPYMDPTSNPDLLMYNMSIEFVVPMSAVPYITGEEGRALPQYYRDTGATVSVDDKPLPDSNDVTVMISGPLCGVQAAHILVIKQVADALMAVAPA
jgi:RNA-binding protein Nova